MRFSVATHRGLYFANEEGECEKISEGYYYGTIVLDDRVLVVRRVNPFTKTSPTVFESFSFDGERLFAPCFNGSDVKDVHQIALLNDEVICTSVEANGLFFFAIDSAGPPYHKITFGNADTASICINSIYIGEKETVWIAFHNRSITESTIRKARLVDNFFTTLATISVPHKGIHNVVQDGDIVYYNASEDGAICRTALSEQKVDVLALKQPLHTKGMAFVPEQNLLISGASESEVSLKDRFSSHSGLCFVDTAEWKFLHSVPLTYQGQTVGNVNEIQVLTLD